VDLDRLRALQRPADTRIVLLVLDGLGGLPAHRDGATELEAARTPHLDRLAREGICGLAEPVAPGITPGSGPAHLALFGYDPLRYEVGRGVLSALGIGFGLRRGDVAARGNFCTLDEARLVSDRRAGRIDSETNRRLCERLREIEIEEAELFIETVKEYRLLMVLRGESLSPEIEDTDPQTTGRAPLEPEPATPDARSTADAVARFLGRARELLADEARANMVLLRGFSSRPSWPLLPSIYGIRAAAVATYTMYRGVAALIGMEVLETGEAFAEQLETVTESWSDYDFFFLHFKSTDSAGEDGDFPRKVELIEAVDRALPQLLDLGPDVLVVTGDHSTPSVLRSHSWHPVPALLWSKTCRPDAVDRFGERSCLSGGLGARLPATSLLPLAFAHAQRLAKFGA
jgi:2,3-bisphosphoglycerate-independent phosphoglycerate mutase